jgi:hypothetical protein
MRKDFVTRQFAHEHFTFRDYEPSWDEIIDGGYHGNIVPPETGAATASRASDTSGPAGTLDTAEKEDSDG